ncbi:MAG: hypothetical protein OIF47_07695 [Marinibacterium sp.]|nr:hypothetical protein [Marinibacterium sp.]
MTGLGIWAGGAGALALTFVLTLALFAIGGADVGTPAEAHVGAKLAMMGEMGISSC